MAGREYRNTADSCPLPGAPGRGVFAVTGFNRAGLPLCVCAGVRERPSPEDIDDHGHQCFPGDLREFRAGRRKKENELPIRRTYICNGMVVCTHVSRIIVSFGRSDLVTFFASYTHVHDFL